MHSAKDVPAVLPDGAGDRGRARARRPARRALRGRGSLGVLEGAAVGDRRACGGGRSCWRSVPTSRSRCAGTWTRGCGKLADGDVDALVLAARGARALGRSDEGVPGGPQLVPAAGQGCLALEARADDRAAAELAAAITDRERWSPDRRAGARGRPRRHLRHARWGRCAEAATAGPELAAYVGLPDGGPWIRDVLGGDAGEPGALDGRSPSG